ncbi:hypothetical protein ACTFIR_002100 [Dictyostelium discoideum]
MEKQLKSIYENNTITNSKIVSSIIHDNEILQNIIINNQNNHHHHNNDKTKLIKQYQQSLLILNNNNNNNNSSLFLNQYNNQTIKFNYPIINNIKNYLKLIYSFDNDNENENENENENDNDNDNDNDNYIDYQAKPLETTPQPLKTPIINNSENNDLFSKITKSDYEVKEIAEKLVDQVSLKSGKSFSPTQKHIKYEFQFIFRVYKFLSDIGIKINEWDFKKPISGKSRFFFFFKCSFRKRVGGI